jgi:hypothetical protein
MFRTVYEGVFASSSPNDGSLGNCTIWPLGPTSGLTVQIYTTAEWDRFKELDSVFRETVEREGVTVG